MSDQRTFRERIRAGDTIQTFCLHTSSTREQVHEAIGSGGPPIDLLYIDAQHGPVSEWDIVRTAASLSRRNWWAATSVSYRGIF